MHGNTGQPPVVDVEHVYAFQPHQIDLHPLTIVIHHIYHRPHHIQHPPEKLKVMLENGAPNIVGNTDAPNINEQKRGVVDDDKLFSSRCFIFSS